MRQFRVNIGDLEDIVTQARAHGQVNGLDHRGLEIVLGGLEQAIIIIDGPDMTGKTQIAKKFSEMTGIPYYKNKLEWDVFDTKNSEKHFRNLAKYGGPFLADFVMQTEASAIFDRQYPSEFAYSRVFDRKTDMGALIRVDEMFSKMISRTVICVRSSYENIVDDKFPKVLTSEKLQELDQAYREFVKWTKCPCLLLDVTDGDLDREIAEIAEFLNLAEKKDT